MMFWFILLIIVVGLVLPIVVLLGLWKLEDIEIAEIDWKDDE
jgi:hypothetical protein